MPLKTVSSSISLYDHCLILLILFLPSTITAQLPPSYYQSIQNQTGDSLKSALNDIIDEHITYSYRNVWDILKELDRDPENPQNVICFYSRFSMDAEQEYDRGNGWTREHIWAQSRGLFGIIKGTGTDLHNLVAVDASTNSAKSNRSFDEGGAIYVDEDGNYRGVTPAKMGEGWTWEPGDEQKGDIARILFYMATRYEGEHGEPDLALTEANLPKEDRSPFHGRLSTILQWHREDPVSEQELVRNELIYELQNNRNPFVDHPEYVELIWESPILPTLFFSEYIEGSSFNKALEIANLSGFPVDLSLYHIRKQTNGSGAWGAPLELSGKLESREVFGIVDEAADPMLIENADLVTNSNVLNFNGNDPIGLFRESRLVDVIGEVNNDGVNFGKDVTLVRNSLKASITFTPQEWIKLEANTFSGFGLLDSSIVQLGKVTSMIKSLSQEDLSLVNVYPNPSQGHLYLKNTPALFLQIESIELVDLTGRLLPAELHMHQDGFTIDTDFKGIAVLQIDTEKGTINRRVVFQ